MASTSASARRCLAVLRSSAPSGLDMESMAALRVVPPTGSRPGVQPVHAAALADEELAALEVVFDFGREALGVDRVPRSGRDVAQVFDREALGVADPHLLVDASADLVNALLQMADDRGRLESDLARAQRLSNYWHRPERAADAQPIGRGGLGHLAFPCHP